MTGVLDRFQKSLGKELEGNGESSLFFNKKKWISEDHFDAKFTRSIDPHSRQWFSPLKPFFLFELKDLGMLGYFSSLLVRDGVWGITRFFCHFPAPGEIETILLIRRDLGYLVPNAWMNNVLFYEVRKKTQVVKLLNQPVQERRQIIFYGTSDSIQRPIEEMGKKLNRVINEIGIEGKDLGSMVSFNPQFLNEEDGIKQNQYHWKLAESLTMVTGQSIKPIHADDLLNLNLSQTLMVNLDSVPFLFSDSYIEFLGLELGAVLLDLELSNKTKTPDFSVDHSFHYELGVFQSLDWNTEAIRSAVQKEYLTFLDLQSLMVKEKNLKREGGDIEDILFSSFDLKHLAISLAKLHGATVKAGS